MDFDTTLWDEIQDMPGEIFDLTDLNETPEVFDFNGYLASDIDY